MPIVSFWGTEKSAQLATTATAVAAAASIGTKYPYRTIITQTHYSDMSMESGFFDMDKLSRKGSLDVSDTGIDALDRLLRTVFASAIRDLLTALVYCGTATAAKIPMIKTTTNSSISVNTAFEQKQPFKLLSFILRTPPFI